MDCFKYIDSMEGIDEDCAPDARIRLLETLYPAFQILEVKEIANLSNWTIVWTVAFYLA